MKKIIPAVIIFFVYEGSYALTLNGNRVIFQTNFPKEKFYKINPTEKVSKLFRFKKPLTQKDIEKYFQEGVESIEYAGDLTYYFYGKRNVIDRLLFKEMKLSFENRENSLIGYAKLSPSLKAKRDLLYGEASKKEDLVLNVVFFDFVDKEEIYKKFKDLSLDVLKIYPNGRSAVVKISSKELKKLLNTPSVKYVEEKINNLKLIEPKKDFSKKRNLVSADMMHVKELWDSPYDLNGKDIKVGVVDGGLVRDTHREFIDGGRSRIVRKNIRGISNHATHVAGTIGAEGLNPKAHGMANKTFIYSYYFNDAYFSSAVLKAYLEDDVMITNHSYGYSDKTRLGEYDYEAYAQDDNIYKHPYILQFLAAGNDRGSTGYSDYGITKGPINSKNVFTIGAVKTDKKLTYFSSTGPVRDGRVKPDLVADGWSLYSCGGDSDSSYVNMSGTSMATPSATGAAVLAAEAYKNVTGEDIRADILKAVLFNSAEDLGREGPDYEYGYGFINLKKAVDLINTLNTSSPLIYTDSIAHQEEKVLTFYVNEQKDVKITISWIDPAGDPNNQERTLVNDIDIKVVGNGKVYYPYTLDKNHPDAPAVKIMPNHTDNSEQIEIKNMPKGRYTLIIKGTLITTDKQDFAIASTVPLLSEVFSVIEFNPKDLYFGNVSVFKESVHKSVEIKNSGSKDLTIYNIDLLNKEDFFINFDISNGCPSSYPFILSPSKKCDFEIYSKPSKEGEIVSKIEISNDSSNDSEASLNLKVDAIDDAPKIALSHELKFDFDSEKDILDKESGWSLEEGCLRSKKIENSQKTDYSFTAKVLKGGEIFFNYSISSELDYDYFKFYINGEEEYSDSGIKKHISYSKTLPKEGEYKFDFEYVKDFEVSLGEDSFCIDYIDIKNAVFEGWTFENTEVLKTSSWKVLSVLNQGVSKLKVSDISLDDKNFKIDFSKGEKPCKKGTFELKQNEYCTFAIAFSPKKEGEYETVLKIESNAKNEMKEIVLKGKGIKTPSKSKTDKYLSFVTFIYKTVFDMDSLSVSDDIKELKNRLSQGESAFKIVKELMESSKFKSLALSDAKYVNILFSLTKDNDSSLYQKYLSDLKNKKITRNLIRDDLLLKSSSWISFCKESGVTAFSNEDKIEGFIERFYNYSLGRDSDKGGLEYWKRSLINRDKNGVEIGVYFFLSPEFQSKKVSDKELIVSLYRTFLNREPDQGGLNYWLGRMKEGLGKRELIKGFAYSKEFGEIASDYGVDAY